MMYRLMIIGALVAASPLHGTAPSAAAAMAPVTITTTRLAEGIYQFTVASDGYVEQLNSVAIVTDTDVLLFDTTTRPSTARTILASIRKLTRKPVRYVVNSHWHPDHWSGNEVFAEAEPGLQIIATEQERDYMMNFASVWPDYFPKALAAEEKAAADKITKGEASPGVPLTADRRAALDLELQHVRDMIAEQLKLKRTYPNLTYTDRLTMHRGGREFQFISVTGDAAGTTVLYLPKEKILITGDTVSYPLPYYTPPLSAHAASLRRLAALDADIIVPGHGPAFRDKSYMLLEAELFEAVLAETQRALRSGAVSIDQVQAAVDLSRFKERFARGDTKVAEQFPAFVKGMVRKAYIELRDSKEIR
jgi:cyclase